MEASVVAAPYAVRRSARVLPPRRLLACDLYSRQRDDGACKGLPLRERYECSLVSVRLPQWLGSLSKARYLKTSIDLFFGDRSPISRNEITVGLTRRDFDGCSANWLHRMENIKFHSDFLNKILLVFLLVIYMYVYIPCTYSAPK